MAASELIRFVEQTAALAGLDGETRSLGISRTHVGCLDGWNVAVGTNGSYYWVDVDLALPGVPVQSGIEWAPRGLAARAKLTEAGDQPPSTGVEGFDSLYLLLGDAAEELAGQLSAEALAAFVTFAAVQPSLRTFDLHTMQPRTHLHCLPSVRGAEQAELPVLGAGAFTPARAARSIREATELAAVIASNLG